MQLLNKKWDMRYLEMARLVSTWSKDPSTKTGAVFVRPNRSVIAIGFNGFAAGVDDSEDRYNDRKIKYEMVIHCEENALIAAQSSVEGSCLYTWPFISCSRCSAKMIQAGVKRHVAPLPSEDALSRWKDAFELSLTQFREAGVEVIQYSMGEINDHRS
jgi:dCMP deaminase